MAGSVGYLFNFCALGPKPEISQKASVISKVGDMKLNLIMNFRPSNERRKTLNRTPKDVVLGGGGDNIFSDLPTPIYGGKTRDIDGAGNKIIHIMLRVINLALDRS